MFNAVVFLFFTFICFITCCPNGSIPSLSDPSKCYYFQTQKTNWIVADQGCKNFGGNLVSIHNAFDNVFLSGEASTIFTDSTSVDFWTGANNLLTPGTWSWVDQTAFDWNDWDISQPQNTSNTNCGSMLIKSERWIASDCMNQKPYVCLTELKELSTTSVLTTTTKRKPLTCLEDWTYFNYTGACYKVFNTATWIDAEERCKVDGAHLASIHSLEENIFLANLAYYPGANVCNGGKQALYGLFTDDAKGHWKYTDGTPFDYSNWWTGITYSLTDAAYGYIHVAPVCNSPGIQTVCRLLFRRLPFRRLTVRRLQTVRRLFLSFRKYSVGELSLVGEMAVGEKAVGEIVVGEKSYNQLAYRSFRIFNR